jgi:MYXO-CTERM domain-containing protein
MSGWRALAVAAVAAGLLAPGEAAAQMALDGTYIDVWYGSNGIWNDYGYGKGLQITNGARVADVTYPGSPWQQISWEYTYSSVAYSASGNIGTATWTTSTASNLSSGTQNKAYHVYSDGRVKVEKTDTWEDGNKYILVQFVVTNTTSSSISSFRLAHGMDPDQDVATYSNYTTYNDRKDLNSDGVIDWVSSIGASSNWSVGYGVCDSSKQTVGHTAGWESDADLSTMTDYNGSSGDYAMHIKHSEGTIAAGASATFTFIFAWDTSESGAQTIYTGSSCAPTVECDADGDGYDSTSSACGGTDCDDTDADISPGASEVCNSIDDDCDGTVDDGVGLPYYRDSDGDGYGDRTVSTISCSAPTGYVYNDSDCDDKDKNDYPGAAETVANGDDEDCDGVDACYLDSDKDKYGSGAIIDTGDLDCTDTGESSVSTDCDDGSATVYPGATETCNGVDDDCDGSVDEGLGSTYYRDADGDGYGDPSSTASSCSATSGYVTNNSDCDDTRSSVNPAASERCNGRDDDCDGTVDESDAIDAKTWYADMDGDAYGDPAVTKKACNAPTDYVSNDDDCDDGNSTIYPGAVEVPYDGIDQDCDGLDDNDLDGDGYAWDGVSGGTDCDDTDATKHTGATESADGEDEDCDGTVDETTDWYDDDEDGFTESGGDCDDTADTTAPAGTEVCNGVDDDCDGVTDEDTECSDDDGDGYSEDDGDCNDADDAAAPDLVEIDDNGVDDDCDGVADSGADDPDRDGYASGSGDCAQLDDTVYPGAPELEDGIDNDCDGTVDEGTDSYDDDGDGFTENEGDCWDGSGDVNPDADESGNGVDDDCDGTLDEGTDTYDDDGDGFTEEQGDCDDADDSVAPGTDESADGRDEDCDGDVDENVGDEDFDGYTTEDGDCDDADGWVNPGLSEMCDNIDNNCNGEIDEGCGEEAPVEEKGCNCATQGNPVGAAWLLGLVLLGARRRR